MNCYEIYSITKTITVIIIIYGVVFLPNTAYATSSDVTLNFCKIIGPNKTDCKIDSLKSIHDIVLEVHKPKDKEIYIKISAALAKNFKSFIISESGHTSIKIPKYKFQFAEES